MSTSGLQQLPPDLLLQMARLLDSRSLGRIAPTCSRLCQAAVAVRSSVSVVRLSPAKHASLCAYLARHGQHITSIQLIGKHKADNRFRVTDLLGCAQLRALTLSHLNLQLAFRAAQHPGMLHSATALSKLEITNCKVADGAVGFEAMAALTRLQHLVVERTTGVDEPHSWGRPKPGYMPGSVLTALQQLQHLELVRCCEPGTLLKHLDQLTSVQELRVEFERSTAPPEAYSGLQHLRQLRVLHLGYETHPGGPFCVDGTTMPWLVHLSGLQELSLPPRAKLDPAVLIHTQLQRLDLSGNVKLTDVGMEGLLAQVQLLQALTSLKICLDGCAAPASSYSALTASSALRELEVTWRKLPVEVWEAVFPAMGSLRALTRLQLEGRQRYVNWIEHYAVEPPPTPLAVALDGAALVRITDCCAHLQSLALLWDHSTFLSWTPTRLVPDLAPLTALSALTSLAVTTVVTEADCAVLAQLTTLSELVVQPCNVRTHAAQRMCGDELLRLTSCQQLTHLYVACESGMCQAAKAGQVAHVKITNKAGDGQRPDVAQQLAELCTRIVG